MSQIITHVRLTASDAHARVSQALKLLMEAQELTEELLNFAPQVNIIGSLTASRRAVEETQTAAEKLLELTK